MLLAFPYLLLAIAVVSALGPGVLNTTIAVGIWGAPTVTRLVRGAVLAARETEYVRAARALGRHRRGACSRATCCATSCPTVIVYSTLFMANAILVEAALSFLGPRASSRRRRRGGSWSRPGATSCWWPRTWRRSRGSPSWSRCSGFNLLGDGLRDALDPRLRGRI